MWMRQKSVRGRLVATDGRMPLEGVIRREGGGGGGGHTRRPLSRRGVAQRA